MTINNTPFNSLAGFDLGKIEELLISGSSSLSNKILILKYDSTNNKYYLLPQEIITSHGQSSTSFVIGVNDYNYNKNFVFSGKTETGTDDILFTSSINISSKSQAMISLKGQLFAKHIDVSDTYEQFIFSTGRNIRYNSNSSYSLARNVYDTFIYTYERDRNKLIAVSNGTQFIERTSNGVIAWGSGTTNQPNGGGDGNEYGQCIIPDAALSGVSAIAAGIRHTIALKDGKVLAWGAGTTNTGWPEFGQCIIPTAALSGVSAIAGGGFHTIALKNGGVLAWGWNDFGQCTIPPAALSGVTQIAGGASHTVALKNGGVLAWGNNDYGQCDIPPDALSGVIAIACGSSHTIALKNNGAVLAWGAGTTDTGGFDYGQSIVPDAAKSGVTAISGGEIHTIALKNDGTVVIWGNNNYGQRNVPASTTFSAIAAGGYHTVAIGYGSSTSTVIISSI